MAAGCKILIGVDDGSHSEDALRWFAEHFYQPSQDVILLHVTDKFPIESQKLRAALRVPDSDVKKFNTERDSKMQELIDKYSAYCKDKLHMETRMLFKPGAVVGPVIVETASEENCQLILIGCRGHGPVLRAVLGTVSSYVVHHSHIPVVIHK